LKDTPNLLVEVRDVNKVKYADYEKAIKHHLQSCYEIVESAMFPSSNKNTSAYKKDKEQLNKALKEDIKVFTLDISKPTSNNRFRNLSDKDVFHLFKSHHREEFAVMFRDFLLEKEKQVSFVFYLFKHIIIIII
jgi:hypothetical protein